MYRVTLAVSAFLLVSAMASRQVCGQTASQPVPSERIPPPELHGGIEISPRVVRAIALRIAESAEGNNIKVLFSYSLPLTSPVLSKDGRLTPDYIRATTLTVQKAFQQLQQQYRVPENQIHILGLSDFTAQNVEELRAEISDKTGRPAIFVNAETETELSIAGIIPRRYRAGGRTFDNRNISMLLDLGSASMRGGYQQLKTRAQGAPEYEFVTWEVPKGTASFATEVAAAAGETADLSTYARRAQAVGGTSVRNLIQTEIARKPALLSRKKVYLTGGIVWAMMTLLHPEDQSNFATITMEDINNFHTRATVDPE
ncbi:MAG: hypothetical protein ACREEM_24700, partial [Blastocatellia bacterium]